MHYLERASVFERWGCPIGRGHIYIYTPLFVRWAVCCGCGVAAYVTSTAHASFSFTCYLCNALLSRCACRVVRACPRVSCDLAESLLSLVIRLVSVMSCFLLMLTNPFVFVSWETFELWVPRYFGFKKKLFFPPTLCPHTFSFLHFRHSIL